MGTMVTATDTIDFDTASLIAMEFHAKVEKEVVVTIEEQIIDDSEDDEANLFKRVVAELGVYLRRDEKREVSQCPAGEKTAQVDRHQHLYRPAARAVRHLLGLKI